MFRLEQEVTELRGRAEETNRARESQQHDAGARLALMHSQWLELLNKNSHIQVPFAFFSLLSSFLPSLFFFFKVCC